MTRVGWLLALLPAGCLLKPDQSGDSACPWSDVPVPIAGDVISTYGEQSAWLDDPRSEVWYTYIYNPIDPDVWRATTATGDWAHDVDPPVIDDGLRQEDPYVDDDNHLWFSANTGPSGTASHIWEADRLGGMALAPPRLHGELGTAYQPALSSDGLRIFYSDDHSRIRTATRGAPGDDFDSSTITTMSYPHHIESPSASQDGSHLYFTDHHLSRDYIGAARLSGSSLTLIDQGGPIGDFQSDPQADYRDPNISADGLTLVFNSTTGGGAPHLYYVTRDCR